MRYAAIAICFLLAACSDDDNDPVRLRQPSTVRICAAGSGHYNASFNLDGSIIFTQGELPNERNVEGSGRLEVSYLTDGNLCLWADFNLACGAPPPDARCGTEATIRVNL